jgi:hypothetical protein
VAMQSELRLPAAPEALARPTEPCPPVEQGLVYAWFRTAWVVVTAIFINAGGTARATG